VSGSASRTGTTSGSLPHTGSNSVPLAAVGSLLVLGGVALLAAERRSRHQPAHSSRNSS
jgi:LPXTG-motif cell wall-anchored protein